VRESPEARGLAGFGWGLGRSACDSGLAWASGRVAPLLRWRAAAALPKNFAFSDEKIRVRRRSCPFFWIRKKTESFFKSLESLQLSKFFKNFRKILKIFRKIKNLEKHKNPNNFFLKIAHARLLSMLPTYNGPAFLVVF